MPKKRDAPERRWHQYLLVQLLPVVVVDISWIAFAWHGVW